ncbi:MAG: Ig-like domain-containing protein [Gemmatimonadales bacterium]
MQTAILTGLVLLVAGCGGGDSTGPSHVVTAVTITGGRDTLYVGQTMFLGASVQLDSSMVVTADSVGWSSSDTTRAKVSATGVVTAVAAGSATITASLAAHQGVRAVTIKVIPVASITVSPASRIIYLGQQAQLTATPKDSAGTPILGRTPIWASRDTSVATVSVSGLVIPHDTGLVRVLATLDGHSDSAAVTSGLVPVTSITLLPAGDTAVVGDTIAPRATPRDSSGAPLLGHPVVWSVSDSTVLEPISGGRFVALANGSVTMFASAGGTNGQGAGLVATCGDTVQVATNAFHFPLVAGQLAHDVSATLDVGLFRSTAAFYGGGVMFGTDSAHMTVAYDPRGDVGDGAAHAGVCPLPLLGLGTYTYTKVRPVPGEGVPPGLRVVQETFASGTPAADSGFVLFRYTFTDTGSVAVAGLRTGFFIDWDLGFDNNPADDVIRYYAGLGWAEAEESDTVTYPQRLTVIPITSAGTASFSGWINGVDPTVRGSYFSRLAAGTTSTAIGPNDIRQLVGTSPVTIPAGGRVVVYFALVGGENEATFAASRAAALAAAAALGFN